MRSPPFAPATRNDRVLRLTDGVPLDPEIRPLCDALAGAGCGTIYSCGAHLNAPHAQPRAYVTFTGPDTRWVQTVRDFLRVPPPALASLERDLHFDCLLGRYTVSVWAPSMADARTRLDAGVARLTAWVEAQSPARSMSGAICTAPDGRVPDIVPCCVTLGPVPTVCGWTGAALTCVA